MPTVKAALAKADGSKLHAQMSAHGKIVLELEGETLELGPEEVEVGSRPSPASPPRPRASASSCSTPSSRRS